MSRTDKTAPHWVQAAQHPHRQIDHRDECEYAEHTYLWARYRNQGTEPCDIDEYATHRGSHLHCRYERPGPWWMWYYRCNHKSVKANDRRIYWNGPSRTEERAMMSKLKQDYRANGEVDDGYVFEHEQHHHSADYWLNW